MPNARHAVAEDGLAPRHFALALGVLLLAAFPGVLGGLQSFFYRDYGVISYPFVHYLRESLRAGELPLWNPLSNCGAPFLAQWGPMVFYPFSLIYLLLPLPWSLGLFCLGHLFLGGLGMYFLAHRWTGDRFAANLAGVAFVFNGATLSCLMWPNYVVALGWMPWVVCWVERGWREGGRPLLLAAIIATLQMLSGVPEIILLTWGFLTAMLLGQLWLRGSAPGKLCARFAGMIALVAGLSAIQLLPFFDLLSHSQRGAGFATAKWAMPAWGWANLLVPMFHYCMTPQQTFFQLGQAFITSYYLGAGVLALAVLAAWRVRTRRVWLLAGFTLAALVMALGDNGPLYPLVKQAIPFLGLARYPVKFVLLAAFTVPLLAAYCVRACREFPANWRAPQWRPVLLAGLAMVGLMAVIVCVGINQPLPYDQPQLTRTNAFWRAVALGLTLVFCFGAFHADSRRLALACRLGVLILIAVDATTHLPRLNPTLPKDAFEPGIIRKNFAFNPPVGPGVGRVMISPAAEELLNFSGEPDLLKQFLGRRRALWSNLNLLDDVPKVNGSSTLQLREQMEVQSLLYGGKGTNFAGLMDFLNVAHQTAQGSAVEWQARTNYLPLATVGARPVFADGPQTLRALSDPAFDARQMVFLPLEARTVITAASAPDARVSLTRFGAQRVALEVQTSQPAMLVVAQSFHDAWRVEVDGVAMPLWRANHAFQAVEVPTGRHQVVLAYRDRKLWGGAVITAMTLLGCAAAWGRMKRRDLDRVVA